MKTINVLTRLLPTVAAVRGSGAFNVVIAKQAPVIAEQLRRAANDDRLVVLPLLGALERLGKATAFEPQQQAMAEVALIADGLIGEIADGTAPRAEVVPSTSRDLLERLRRDAAALVDVFSPPVATVASIRADAAELASLIDAEIRDGDRDASHALVAARLYDAAERIGETGHDARQGGVAAIARHAAELAA